LEAVRDRTCDRQYGRDGSLVAAEVQGCCEHMDHPWLLDMVRVRLDDRALLHLIRQWLKAGIVDTAGPVVHPKTGTPQGGPVSPVLAHGYLPDALDLWCEHVGKPRGRGAARWCRYAEDWVWAFRFQEDAERFLRVWPKRLGKCHLQVAPEKPQLRRCSRCPPSTKRRCTFLGCAFFWRRDRHGVPRVLRRTARTKLHAACPRRTEWSTQHRHLPGRACFQRLPARLRGHDNAYGVRGHSRALHRFFHGAMDRTFTWRNRRGGKQSSDTWEQCTRVLDRVKRARPRLTEVPRRRVCA
jgi:RNA-directed DNA polymerase